MVIGVPCISRPDLLRRLLDSLDVEAEVVVIDNSPDGSIAEAVADRDLTLVVPPSNLGVAASWNLVVRCYPDEPYWILANADTELAPGDLDRLALEMAKPGPSWVGMNGDWRVMALNRECVDVVGLFDENFHPIYCEDADYERRCSLAGVDWYFIAGGATHEGSATIRSDARYAARNAETHPSNFDYYQRKWGGHLRGGEVFVSPFNRGGPVSEWTLDVSRLRTNAW